MLKLIKILLPLKFKEKVELINFYLYNIKYQCEEGMTWRDFVNSKYNIKNWTVFDGYKIKNEYGSDVSSKNGLVKPSDLIINEYEYFMTKTDPT